jgi:hypothetical protein
MQNIEDLRKSLSENYEAMKAGKMELKEGKELSNCAGKIISSVKLELEYQMMMGIKQEIAFMQKPTE